jgi:hypothetical protein
VRCLSKIRHECVRKKKPKGGLGYKIIVVNRALFADIEVGVSRRSDQFIVLYVPKEPAGVLKLVTRSLAEWIGRQGYDISCHASHEELSRVRHGVGHLKSRKSEAEYGESGIVGRHPPI